MRDVKSKENKRHGIHRSQNNFSFVLNAYDGQNGVGAENRNENNGEIPHEHGAGSKRVDNVYADCMAYVKNPSGGRSEAKRDIRRFFRIVEIGKDGQAEREDGGDD